MPHKFNAARSDKITKQKHRLMQYVYYPFDYTALLYKSSRAQCRESSVVTDGYEQTDIAYRQKHILDCLQ